MKLHRQFIIDLQGNARVGLKVEVRLAGTATKAALFVADNPLGSSKANPLTTDAEGMVDFYVADGRYDLVANPGLSSEEVIDTVEVVDVLEMKHRSMLVPDGETAPALPSQASRALKFLAFDAAGNPSMLGGTGNDPDLRGELAVPGGANLVFGCDPFVEVASSSYTAAIAADTSQSIFKPSSSAGFHWMRNRGGGQGVLWSSDFPSLSAAIAVWMRLGGTLVINRDHDFSTKISATMVAGLSYQLECDRGRLLNYTGSMTDSAFYLLSTGRNPFILDGDLTVQGNRNCNNAVWIDMQLVESTDRRDCRISGLKASGSYMRVGSNLYNSTCLRVGGGYDRLIIEDYVLDDCNREAGTSVASSKGCYQLSIGTALGTTKGAKHVHVRNGIHRNVGAGDTPGTSAYSEMDAINCFQSAEAAETAPVFEHLRFEEASVGRAIKCFAPIGGAVTRNIDIRQSGCMAGAPGGNGPILIDHQAGDGTIERVTIRLSGDANDGGPTTLIGMSSEYDLQFRNTVINNIDCIDTTGVTKRQLISLEYGAVATKEQNIEIANVRDTGTATCVSRIRSLGLYARHTVDLRNFDVNLTNALFQSDAAQNYLYVRARNMVNRSGANVPALCYYAGTQRLTDWGDFHHEGPAPGFARYVGNHRNNSTWTNGFRGPGGGVEAAPVPGRSEVRGRVTFPARAIAAGATTRWPPTGQHNPSSGNYTGQINNVTFGGSGGFFHFSKAAGSTNFTTINSGSTTGMALVNGGAGTGTGTNVEFYIDSTTNELICENRSAAEVVIQFTANP